MPVSNATTREMEDVLARYRRLRGWNLRSWVLLVLAIGCLVVFRQPQAWGDGTMASALYWTAWIALGLSAIAIHLSGTRLAEQVGFCLGKFGERPSKLG